ncbi:MAG: aldo/keto reductase [Firmicutes bacterium]|nr:aldo/keto reductase [Bacillota bacterium]
MNYKPYGKTGLTISRLGFGAWQLGNESFWGEMTEEEGVKLVKDAINKGITFFDTSPGYAAGLSEIIIGKGIKGQREKVVINTKFGHKVDGTSDFSVEAIEPSLRDSLKRLDTTYIDSLILHNPEPDILSGKTGHFTELKRLKELGLIKAYGVSIDTYQELKTTIEKTDCQVIELLFNVFFQAPAPIFTFVKSKKIALIAKVPLDSGWLTGKYNQHSTFTGVRSRWNQESIKRRADLVEKMKRMTNDTDLTKYALGFIWSFDAVTAVIPGIKNLEQLSANLEAEAFEFPYKLKQSFIDLYNQQLKNKPLSW